MVSNVGTNSAPSPIQGRTLPLHKAQSPTAIAAFESFIKLMFFNGQEKTVRSHSPMKGALMAVDYNHPWCQTLSIRRLYAASNDWKRPI
ncbi:hypothetical protein [Limnohabitans sp.]|jgi:hypothetical protein|uniref:hypothetical protein n=1 Tax=Limnohabitans sp. TaxID=1907725 RepID=UPI0025C05D93|nr:hypothetical protein [Limnohabitans sp.]